MDTHTYMPATVFASLNRRPLHAVVPANSRHAVQCLMATILLTYTSGGEGGPRPGLETFTLKLRRHEQVFLVIFMPRLGGAYCFRRVPFATGVVFATEVS